MPKTDIYASFAALSSDQLEGRDYVICIRRVRDSRIAILAPHGGKIEPLTAELAYSIAGNEHNVYAFKGIKSSGNRDLHITSTNFDEPKALNLIASCDHILTIHGLRKRDCSIQIG